MRLHRKKQWHHHGPTHNLEPFSRQHLRRHVGRYICLRFHHRPYTHDTNTNTYAAAKWSADTDADAAGNGE